jgi:hypothetical protein
MEQPPAITFSMYVYRFCVWYNALYHTLLFNSLLAHLEPCSLIFFVILQLLVSQLTSLSFFMII